MRLKKKGKKKSINQSNNPRMSLMLSFAVHRHKQNELIQHIHKIYETYDLFYLIAISIQRIKQKNAHNFWVWLVQIDRRPKESHTHRKVPANFREFFFFFFFFFYHPLPDELALRGISSPQHKETKKNDFWTSKRERYSPTRQKK